ncbi:uncharacterized protein V5649_013829 [Rhynchonycteris naso]
MVSPSQGAGCSSGGAAAVAGRKPFRVEKLPPGPPLARTAPGPAAPPAPRAACEPAPMSGWATCDPRGRAGPDRPLRPARLVRSLGPPAAPRKIATSETSPGRAGRGSRPRPRTSPLPRSQEATIPASGAGRLVRERARAGRKSTRYRKTERRKQITMAIPLPRDNNHLYLVYIFLVFVCVYIDEENECRRLNNLTESHTGLNPGTQPQEFKARAHVNTL